MWLICVLLITLPIGQAQFPDDVYVTEDKEIISDLLKRHQFEESEANDTEETRVTLEKLMPYPCDDLYNMKKHYLRDFGHVATHMRTFTEVLTTQGRYYPNVGEYDKNCACPPVYQVLWNLARGKHKILSAEQRQGYVPQETTQTRAEERQMYVIFYENNNVVEYRSNIMTVIGNEDPRIVSQRITNFTQRFLYGMRYHQQPKTIEYKVLAQHNLQSVIKRTVANYTDNQGYVRTYRYLQVTDLDIITQLRMIDHVIAILYETYEWVEWKVTAINAHEVDPNWRTLNRHEPCQIAADEAWGIKYTRGTRGTLRVCDFHEYSYMLNASDYSFELIMPIGSFEPANLSQDFRYDLRERNSIVIWNFVESSIGDNAMIKVKFWHGMVRSRPTSIYSLVTNNIHSRFHRNFLLSPWWKLARTQLMINEQDEMCERTEYTNFVRRLEENERPTTPTDKYRTLRVMHNRHPDSCQIVYTNTYRCRKPRNEGQCRYAVGASSTTYFRSEMRTDPWQNEPKISQAQICFLENVTLNQIRAEPIVSATKEIIGIKVEPELRYEINQQLRTFSQIWRDQGRNQADAMNRVLALLEERMSEIRTIGIIGSHEENLRARYAARRAVTRTGESSINWEQKFENAQDNINRTLARMREIELEISNLEDEAKRKIGSYYLYKRIRLMLPHLIPASNLERGKVYKISLKKGELIIQHLSWFRRKIRGNTVGSVRTSTKASSTTSQATRQIVTTTSNNDTYQTKDTTSPEITEKPIITSRGITESNENTSPETTEEPAMLSKGVTESKEATLKITTESQGFTLDIKTTRKSEHQTQDEYHQIINLIENELEDHKMSHDKWKQMKPENEGNLEEILNGKRKQSEPFLLVLITIATVIGTVAILSLCYKLVDRKRKNHMISLNKAKSLIDKTKDLPFTDER